MTAYEIPLKAEAQAFNITLGAIVYNFNVHWNTFAGVWFIDIADQNNTPLVQGVALITGADLLDPYSYLGFGFELIVQTDFNTFAAPTYENLGNTSHLYAVFP
jgi:hypothetical protein